VREHTTQRNTDALLQARGEVGLEANTGKTKYKVMSRHQHAGKNHNLLTANKCFENVAKFKYLGTTITSQNFIHEGMERRLDSLTNTLSSRLFSKNKTTKL
jgi:hypothetical protein